MVSWYVMLNTRATLYPSVFLFVQKSRLNAMMNDDDDDDDDGLMFQRVLHRSTHQILVYHRIRFQRVHFCV